MLKTRVWKVFQYATSTPFLRVQWANTDRKEYLSSHVFCTLTIANPDGVRMYVDATSTGKALRPIPPS